MAGKPRIRMEMQLHGLAALQEQLREIADDIGSQKVLRAAARKAFVPVLEQARANAPVDTGILKESIQIATALPQAGDVIAAVGLVVVKNKAFGGDIRKDASWRWHFTERGTQFQRPQPFMRPALNENAAGVVAAFQADLAKRIHRIARKNRKNARAAMKSAPSIKDFLRGMK